MSGQPFSFPPPPPPPPKRTIEGAYQPHHGYQNGRGSFRGGRAYQGNVRGGRGDYGHHRSGPPAFPTDYESTYGQSSSHKSWNNGPPASSTEHRPAYGQNHSHRSWNNGPPRGGSFSPPQKRDHSTAFRQPQQPRSRPTAPPAVPNFNASIEHLLARKPPADQNTPRPIESKRAGTCAKPQKQNLLGLTPAKFEHDSDPEDDEGEEKRLADQTATALGAHLFEYNGNPLLLRTREEILAWIAERKRRFPTEARREAAKKEADEKRRKREEAYQATQDARKEAMAKRDQERVERRKTDEKSKKARKQEHKARNLVPEVDDAIRARLRAEKLRTKALKAQRELEKAEEALRIVQARKDTFINPPSPPELDQAPVPEPADSLQNLAGVIEDDETSSSGSSTGDSDPDLESDSGSASDSDSAPEVTNIKHAARGFDLFPRQRPRQARKVKDKSSRICAHFAKYKSCKYGSDCHLSHDLSRKGRKDAAEGRVKNQRRDAEVLASGNAKRKGLWQIMAEKEQEEERKRLLGAIMALGEGGLLDDPSEKPAGL